MVDVFNGEGRATNETSVASARRIAILPGSRIGEIRRILPRLLKSLHLLKTPAEVLIPAANDAAYLEIDRLVRLNPPPDSCRLSIVRGGARDVLRRADCAAVASGTATLEAALARCPTVLVYAVSPLLAWFARRVITGVRHIGLANIIAEKAGTECPMPELLQEDFTAEAVAGRLREWLTDGEANAAARRRLSETVASLRPDVDPITAVRGFLV